MSTEIDFGELEKTLLPWLNINSKAFTYHIMKTLKQNGIDSSREQMMILKHLTQEDGQIQGDLAFITNRDKTSLTRIVNNMQKKGLLLRVQCEHDNRRNKIFISEKGKALFNKGFPIVKDIVGQVQGNLSDEEISSTINVLKKVFVNLNQLHEESRVD